MRPRIDYLAIPVNYGVKAGNLVSIYGGVTPHLMIKNIIRGNRFTGNSDDIKEKWDSTDNPVEAKGLVIFANFGMSFYLNDGISLIDLKINRSLGSVYDDPNLTETIFNETKLWNIELGIGVFINKE